MDVPTPQKDLKAATYAQIRKLCTGPVFLIALVCYGISMLLQIVNTVDVYLTDTARGIKSDVILGEMLTLVGSLIPSILIFIGLLVTFISATRYNASNQITSAGLSIIQVLSVISLVGLGIYGLVALFGILMAEYFLLAYLILVGGILTLGFFFLFGVLKSLSAAKYTLKTGEPDSGVSPFVGVMCFVIGGILVLVCGLLLLNGAAANTMLWLSLSGLVSAIATVMFGALLFQYKSAMMPLERRSHPAPLGVSYGTGYAPAPTPPSAPPAPNSHIPTWKRIQMEEQNKQ